MIYMQEDRKYELIIGDYSANDGLKITDLQVRFDIQLHSDNKRTGSSAVVEVFNLSRATLGKLEKDFEYCSLAVGYRDTGLQTILIGNITRTATQRNGADQITKLFLGESYTSLNHQRLNTLVAPGKTYEDVIEEIRRHMPGVARGAYACDNLGGPIPYGYPLNGSPRQLLDKLCRAQSWEYHVLNSALYVSEENGLTSKDPSAAPLISQETGLIGIPYYESPPPQDLPTQPRRAGGVRFTALLNPSVEPGKLVRLESNVLPQLNGFYRVSAVRYSGDYRGNDWTMEISATQVSNEELHNQ